MSGSPEPAAQERKRSTIISPPHSRRVPPPQPFLLQSRGAAMHGVERRDLELALGGRTEVRQRSTAEARQVAVSRTFTCTDAGRAERSVDLPKRAMGEKRGSCLGGRVGAGVEGGGHDVTINSRSSHHHHSQTAAPSPPSHTPARREPPALGTPRRTCGREEWRRKTA